MPDPRPDIDTFGAWLSSQPPAPWVGDTLRDTSTETYQRRRGLYQHLATLVDAAGTEPTPQLRFELRRTLNQLEETR